ncbi:MAG: hypothetical protein CM1200mP40_01290 [Gammaproteobacteria bacterium]|nr:MAG: hypothetical protein CM1200mP40_01290 [Gammaproteobacteria bacterium]
MEHQECSSTLSEIAIALAEFKGPVAVSKIDVFGRRIVLIAVIVSVLNIINLALMFLIGLPGK